jgi:hypothetical protein
MKIVCIDTEFYNTKEEYVTPVCCVLEHDGKLVTFNTIEDVKECRDYIHALNCNNYVFVSFAFEAEARFMQAIGYDPLENKVKAVDLYILYRLLANRFDDFQYGKHLVDGKVKVLRKPPSKWEEPDEDAIGSGQQMQYGLASATFKFLGVIRDTEDKDKARDRIIKGGPFSEDEMNWIMRYCEEDTKHLPALAAKMFKYYFEGIPRASYPCLIKLSHYATLTAEMVRIGYPIELTWLKRVTDAVPFLIKDLQRDLLQQSRDLGLPFLPLRYDRKEDCFVENQKLIKDYIAATYPNHDKTDKDNVSLEEDSLWKLRTPDTQPKQFIDHFIHYRWTRKTLNSFKPGGGKRGIWDYIGSDGRCRPYFGIFGAQTSRSQPASSGFIFLKAASLRHLVQPKPGKIIFGIDYSSQEFLINAILAEDDAMIEAYRSGDPYMYLAKAIGSVPQNGTRANYGPQRTEAKELELGLSYGMGAHGVASRIGCEEERAKELIAMRAGVYSGLTDYRADLKIRYKYTHEILMLPDGWAHGPDNVNDLSMMNFPTQGHGAVIMREAARLSYIAKLPLIFTLHDALYYEIDDNMLHLIAMANKLMIKAFANIMGDAMAIRTEIHAWGPCFPREYPIGENGKPEHTRMRVPGTDLEFTCENMYWDDKVTVKERNKWHNFVLAPDTGLFD